jgi:hypothetical protein
VNPAVSVLLTAYNHEDFIEQALESVASQTCRDFEFIVSDDCSTDGSADRIRSWFQRTSMPATLIFNETNLGITKVRNNALRKASGEYVCSLAADDFYEPNRIAVQLAAFKTAPTSVAVIYSDMKVVNAEGLVTEQSYLGRSLRPEGRVWEALLTRNFVPAPAAMIRRSAIGAVGGYDEQLLVEDYDMWLRLADRFEFRHVDAIVTNWRLLLTSLSHNATLTEPRLDSIARSLLKWTGRSDASDHLIANHLWAIAFEAAQVDPALAAPHLRRATALGLRGRPRLLQPFWRLPGFPRLAVFVLAARRRRRDAC